MAAVGLGEAEGRAVAVDRPCFPVVAGQQAVILAYETGLVVPGDLPD